jgi:hypothetical protein
VAYDAAVRVWYGPESYQHALWLKPTGFTPGGSPATLPTIVYRPGGGWAGADIADLYERIWWRFGLGDPTSSYEADYNVFVLNTASVGYNRHVFAAVLAWANGTVYALNTRVRHGGRRWICWTAHTAVTATDEPGVGSAWESKWRDVGPAGLAAWVDGTAYTLGTQVGHDVNAGAPVDMRPFTCIDAHTAVEADNAPGLGTTWDTKWREIGRNETGDRQVTDQGELTPGGLDEAVGNVQQFIGWLRRNTATYGINPAQICVAGASAGGQLAGCAAYAESIPWAKDSQIYGAARDAFYTSTRPNAALLSITPVDLVRHTTLGLLNGLYGELDAGENAEWVAFDARVKQAMSPLYVLKRTGLAIPTCLEYIGADVAGHTVGTAFTGLTGSPYHHPDNGWLMLQYLTAARTTGLGQSGHRFYDNVAFTAGTGTLLDPVVPLATVFRYYATFNGAATNVGTAGTPQVAAESIINWVSGALGL